MISVLIFSITYLFIALGRIPCFVIDRTGIALLGAIAMVVFGVLPFNSAVTAIDFPTIILLYGLMILSAQFRIAGFYRWIALKASALITKPRLFLLIIMLLSGGLASVLTNDVICLSFTPLIIFALAKNGKLNPVPYLIGLAVSSNIGSAITIIGNPQNILIAQVGNLNFLNFLIWSFIPSFFSMAAAFIIICFIYRKTLYIETTIESGELEKFSEVKLNQWQCTKGIILTSLVIFLFFTEIPREITVMAAAGIILCSRKITTGSIFELIDWKLLTLFCALFIVIKGITVGGHDKYLLSLLNQYGFKLENPIVLAFTSGIMGNIFSNVPSTMLLLKFINSSQKELYYILSLSATFSGNFMIIGSIANLIVVEQAKTFGINISFSEYFKTGWLVTAASFVFLISWILI